MKKITTLLFLLFALPFYAQWMQQNSGVSAPLSDVYCISEDVVVVVGESGTILKTTNGGINWIQKTSGTANHLMKTQFINPNVGYAVGSAGTLLKTVDSGETWSQIATGATTDLYGLSALNENVFYISGDNGLIKKTVNGGNSFEIQPTPVNQTIKDVQYLNELTGYAQADKLLKTSDGGMIWSVITSDDISSIFFLDENIGFINSMNWETLKTTDGGLNFSSFSPGFYLGALFSLNENAVWGVESQGLLCGCPTFCIIKGEITDTEGYQESYNCGLGGGLGTRFNGIYFANDTKGYVVGWGGAIFKNSTGVMGVNDVDKKDPITIYPNPASNYVTVSFTKNPSQSFSIEIMDCLGKTVFSKTYGTENHTMINTEDLAKGVYFLTLKSEEKKLTEKLIIN